MISFCPVVKLINAFKPVRKVMNKVVPSLRVIARSFADSSSDISKGAKTSVMEAVWSESGRSHGSLRMGSSPES